MVLIVYYIDISTRVGSTFFSLKLGSTLAHAFKPSNGGTHFDDDERWTLASENSAKDQIHLPTVVLHEIGHTLGLGHSSDYTSVMSPFFTTIKTKLTPVDISMLRALYGECCSYVKQKFTSLCNNVFYS